MIRYYYYYYLFLLFLSIRHRRDRQTWRQEHCKMIFLNLFICSRLQQQQQQQQHQQKLQQQQKLDKVDQYTQILEKKLAYMKSSRTALIVAVVILCILFLGALVGALLLAFPGALGKCHYGTDDRLPVLGMGTRYVCPTTWPAYPSWENLPGINFTTKTATSTPKGLCGRHRSQSR